MAVKVPGHSPTLGHSYKLCPYSTQYKEAYYDHGYMGNSTSGVLPMSHTSDHDDTSGTMITSMRARAWGFMCMDDDCWYFLNNGVRYFEC